MVTCIVWANMHAGFHNLSKPDCITSHFYVGRFNCNWPFIMPALAIADILVKAAFTGKLHSLWNQLAAVISQI